MHEFKSVRIVMKPRRFSSRLATAAFSAAFLSASIFAADAPPADNTSVAITVPAPQSAPKTAWMSREAGEVLKLVRAGVNEEVVMAYIQHSRSGFNLTADEIVQLHNEGVTDKMINAMLANKRVPQTMIAVQQQPQPAGVPEQAPVQQQVIQPTTPPPSIAAPPPTTYVQTQPVYVPSTTYVYSDPYYYYDPYWSLWYPSVSVGFGWGWGGWGGRYYRPYYGGHYYSHYGGGYHNVYRGGVSAGFHGGFGGHVGGGFSGGHVGGGWGGSYRGGFGGGGHHR
jgi:hypothetical protein